MTEREPIRDRIRGFAGLPADWDGYDGRAPSDAAIAAALAVVDALPDWAFPTETHAIGDGEIIFKWRTEDAYLEIGLEGETFSWGARIGDVGLLHGDLPFEPGDALPADMLTTLKRIKP